MSIPSASDLQNGFAARLRRAREVRGFRTQTALARLIGVDSDTVSVWEGGRNFPRPRELFVLCEHLDVSADWLLFGKPRGLDATAYQALVGNSRAS